MIKKYIKNPIPIEAVQWNGENIKEIADFIGEYTGEIRGGSLYIKTIEGDMFAPIGSYIIKGVNGEFYPCREDIFEKTYEEVSASVS
jgi:hypothetical protein